MKNNILYRKNYMYYIFYYAIVSIIFWGKTSKIYLKAVTKDITIENTTMAMFYSEFEKFGTNKFKIPVDDSLSNKMAMIIKQYSLESIEETDNDMVFGIIFEDSNKNRIIIYPDCKDKTYIKIFGTTTDCFCTSLSLYTELSEVLERNISAETAYYTPVVTVINSYNNDSYFIDIQTKSHDCKYYEIISENGYFPGNDVKSKKIICNIEQNVTEYCLNKNIKVDVLTINFYNEKGEVITTQKQNVYNNKIKTEELDLDRLVLY